MHCITGYMHKYFLSLPVIYPLSTFLYTFEMETPKQHASLKPEPCHLIKSKYSFSSQGLASILTLIEDSSAHE